MLDLNIRGNATYNGEHGDNYIYYIDIYLGIIVIHHEERDYSISDIGSLLASSLASEYVESLVDYYKFWNSFKYDDGNSFLYFEMLDNRIVNYDNIYPKNGEILGSYVKTIKGTVESGYSTVDIHYFKYGFVSEKFFIKDAFLLSSNIDSNGGAWSSFWSNQIDNDISILYRGTTLVSDLSEITYEITSLPEKIETTCCILVCCEPDKYILK